MIESRRRRICSRRADVYAAAVDADDFWTFIELSHRAGPQSRATVRPMCGCRLVVRCSGTRSRTGAHPATMPGHYIVTTGERRTYDKTDSIGALRFVLN
jgi:hypothetical protein